MTVVAGKPTIPEVVPLIRAYYAKPGNGMGGAFHCVLEDGNCTLEMLPQPEELLAKDDEDGARLATLLRKMTKTQRRNLHRLYSFYPWA